MATPTDPDTPKRTKAPCGKRLQHMELEMAGQQTTKASQHSKASESAMVTKAPAAGGVEGIEGKSTPTSQTEGQRNVYLVS